MSKKTTTIHIDETVLASAKKSIPNFSLFVENCLRAYLGSDDDVTSIQGELDKIKDSYLQIHLLSNKQVKKEQNMMLNNDEINKIWLKLWSNYRTVGACEFEDLKELSDKTNVDVDIINDMLDDFHLYLDKSEYKKLNEWDKAYKLYVDLKK